MKMKPEDSDKRIVPFQKEREDSLKEVASRFRENVKKLPTEDERKLASLCMTTLRIFAPGPRVCRVMGNFLIDMANTVEEQDKKHGTDTNDPNQLTAVVVNKRRGRVV